MHDPHDHNEAGWYELRLRGHLDQRWSAWFEGFTITLEDGGSTRLTGYVTDQAALYGLLKKVRDLGMPLLSVHRVDPHQPGAAEIEP